MLEKVLLGCMLVVSTTAVHAIFTRLVIGSLELMHADRWAYGSAVRRTLLLGFLVLLMFLAGLVEVAMWAACYLAVGAMEAFEGALYFSMVTYTTLGYGDVTLGPDWRLLASFEAANGTIMFGWTTAIVVAVLHQMVTRETDSSST